MVSDLRRGDADTESVLGGVETEDEKSVRIKNGVPVVQAKEPTHTL